MHSTDNNHSNLWLTLVSFLTSVFGFAVKYITQANIAWAIGCAAGVVSIMAGMMTIREKYYSIKKLKKEGRHGK